MTSEAQRRVHFVRDPKKLEALRIGTDFAIAGKTERAKFWLQKSMPNPWAALMLAQLHARSRAVRASKRATWYLSHAMGESEYLDLAGRREVEVLARDLMSRNFDAYGNPTPPSGDGLVDLQRYRASQQQKPDRAC